MKRIFLFLFSLALLSGISRAQGTLQFNQVKMVTTLETVPAGKVWKILSAPYKNDVIGSAGSYTYSNPGVEFVQSMNINGDIIYIQALRVYDGSWRNFVGRNLRVTTLDSGGNNSSGRNGGSLSIGHGIQCDSRMKRSIT